MLSNPSIKLGKRAIISGRTGSGKSTLACWFLSRSNFRWIIVNPKWTSAYKNLSGSTILKNLSIKEIDKKIKQYQYLILNIGGIEAQPEILDEFIGILHEGYRDIGLCIDELYAVHHNGRAGEGLINFLTRGREFRQSFLGLTQRPAWLTKFLYSECDYLGIMALNLLDDRKRLYEQIGRDTILKSLPPQKWYWYDVNKDNLRLFSPIPVDNI